MPPKTKRLTKKEQQALLRRQLLSNANQVVDFLVEFKAFSAYQMKNSEETMHLRSLHASALTLEEHEQIERLFCANMQTLYENSSWGFDMEKKRIELFEPEARYIVVEHPRGQIEAFVHFRFVDDDGDPVVYIYEIQVSSNVQRQGVGKRLMQVVELVARKYKMKFIVLTVFKSNDQAMQFYMTKMGFEIDETSPSAQGDDSESYEILSKALS
ncbi:hypothetical protein LEN26_005525 [Aphanomyces euteiches]|nr:hypothetical protein AeMF1_009101 [Aphanomyces euteiches]KAH9137941.1 hypothetical protein LEN26_005525 [Aphanomyces euteiches]KAH9197972.1 hypothetical protein AeNC1_000063 [Aphanomyces euteiches]